MPVQLTHLHVNSYCVSKVYFGCVIMDMTDAQDKELRRAYEKPLTRKLCLGSNFTKKILSGRVTAMGVGVMTPKIVMADLILKMHLFKKRMKAENGKNTKNNRK